MNKKYIKWQRSGNARHFAKPYHKLYSQLLRSAKARLIPITLTYENYVKRFCGTPRCHYCNKKIKWVKHGEKATTVNLDRKNHKRGYTLRNCVVSCSRCNYARGRNFSYKEWFAMTELFRR